MRLFLNDFQTLYMCKNVSAYSISKSYLRIRKEFLENEAELSGSDLGSADEDERGLDRLMQEEGDLVLVFASLEFSLLFSLEFSGVTQLGTIPESLTVCSSSDLSSSKSGISFSVAGSMLSPHSLTTWDSSFFSRFWT